MYDFQTLIFRAASRWSEATSLVVLSLGLLYTLQGFRFVRFLMPLSCAAGGAVVGGIMAGLVGFPPIFVAVSAGLFGIMALARYRLGLVLVSAFVFAALAQYMAIRLGLRPNMSLIAACVGICAGVALAWVYRRVLPIVVTIVQGAGLLVVGFVGVSTALAPTLGLTFIDWSSRIPMMVPALMLMLCALGYSVQANAVQGDMETGGDPGLGDAEAS